MLNKFSIHSYLIKLRIMYCKREKSYLPLLNRASLLRVTYFSRLLEHVKQVEGAIIECGVGQGVGLASWATLALSNSQKRLIWGFDSFEGFPALAKEDGANANFIAGLSEYKKFTIPYVLETLRQFGIARQDIDSGMVFAKGYIPDSLSLYDKKPIALLHLDLDIYESYKDALNFFWEYVAPGGIVAFDEYNKPLDVHKWPGAQKAINEFLDTRNLKEFLQKDTAYGNVYLQKPL